MPDILRTPDERFANVPDFDYPPQYVQLDDTRMHYVDAGEGAETLLCLHGEPSWSFLYRHLLAAFVGDHRAIAPDLIGFGRSDKYAAPEDYSFAMHAAKLHAFIEALDLHNITLVCQDWGGILGLNAVRHMPERFARLVVMNTGLPSGQEPAPRAFLAWQKTSARMKDMPVGEMLQQGTATTLPDAVVAAYDAPFPDARYKAGAHIFPSLVPTAPDHPGASDMQATRAFLKNWHKPALVMFSDGDPITRGGDTFFRKLIPSANQQPEIIITGGGHFLQEDNGPELAQHMLDFIRRTT